MLCVFQDSVCSCFACTVILHLWCHLCLCAHFESFCRVFYASLCLHLSEVKRHHLIVIIWIWMIENDMKLYLYFVAVLHAWICFHLLCFLCVFFAVSHFVLCRWSHFVELVLRFLDPNSQSVSCQCLYYILSNFKANVFTWVFQFLMQLLIH